MTDPTKREYERLLEQAMGSPEFMAQVRQAVLESPICQAKDAEITALRKEVADLEKIEEAARALLEDRPGWMIGRDATRCLCGCDAQVEALRAALASPEVKPTGEGERCVTCGGAGCMNVLGEFADDDRTEVCPRCHGCGKTP